MGRGVIISRPRRHHQARGVRHDLRSWFHLLIVKSRSLAFGVRLYVDCHTIAPCPCQPDTSYRDSFPPGLDESTISDVDVISREMHCAQPRTATRILAGGPNIVSLIVIMQLFHSLTIAAFAAAMLAAAGSHARELRQATETIATDDRVRAH